MAKSTAPRIENAKWYYILSISHYFTKFRHNILHSDWKKGFSKRMSYLSKCYWTAIWYNGLGLYLEINHLLWWCSSSLRTVCRVIYYVTLTNVFFLAKISKDTIKISKCKRSAIQWHSIWYMGLENRFSCFLTTVQNVKMVHSWKIYISVCIFYLIHRVVLCLIGKTKQLWSANLR